MKVTFEHLRRDHFPTVQRWLNADHVVAWFGLDRPGTPEEFETKYGPRADGESATDVHVVRVDGVEVGFIQWTPASEYAWWPTELGLVDAVALDGLLGEPAFLGRGLAPLVLREFLHAAPSDLGGAAQVIGETRKDNTAMCRTFERSGFACVFEGDLPRDERFGRRVYVIARRQLPTRPEGLADQGGGWRA